MYVRKIKFETTFDGQVVTAVLSPLTFEDLLQIQSISESDEEKASLQLAVLLTPKLRTYVSEFNGPVDEDGIKVPIDEVCSTAYFSRLVVQLINKLAKAAVPPQKPVEHSAS